MAVSTVQTCGLHKFSSWVCKQFFLPLSVAFGWAEICRACSVSFWDLRLTSAAAFSCLLWLAVLLVARQHTDKLDVFDILLYLACQSSLQTVDPLSYPCWGSVYSALLKPTVEQLIIACTPLTSSCFYWNTFTILFILLKTGRRHCLLIQKTRVLHHASGLLWLWDMNSPINGLEILLLWYLIFLSAQIYPSVSCCTLFWPHSFKFGYDAGPKIKHFLMCSVLVMF